MTLNTTPLRRVLVVDGTCHLGTSIAKVLSSDCLAADFDGDTGWNVQRVIVPRKFRKQPKQRAQAKSKRGRLYDIWC